MKRIALIEDCMVFSVAAWDGEAEWHPGDQFTLVDVTERPEIGRNWLYTDGVFSAPIPEEISE